MKNSMNDDQILEAAAEIIRKQYVRQEAFTSSTASKQYLQFKLGTKESETFAVMYLDSQHQLIEYREMFHGTINAASVYPREILKACLEVNAAVVILAHNHPSGDPTPSEDDKRITNKIKTALDYISVTLLDHVVVGKTTFSFAESHMIFS